MSAVLRLRDADEPEPRKTGIVRLVTPPKTAPAVAEVDAARAEELAREKELCDRARAGDKRALAEILRKYGPLLYRSVLLPRLGSDAAAQDALADTYMRVVERFGQFEWRGCGVYPWLRVVAMRIALDALRARKRETLFEPDDLARAADDAERDFEQGLDAQVCEKRDLEAAKERLDRALGQINSRYASAIRMRILEEKSREEAAAALGVTVPTLDVVLHRALKALKKALSARDGAAGEPGEEES
jgi:RNA polymerase sigma factor (sigma-70 family)